MSLKLPPEKKRTLRILIPVNVAEKSAIEKLAAARGVSAAQVLRELVVRECRSVREAKKTEAA